MEPSNYLRCPTCGQLDMVQKVSAVVEGGTTHGSSYSVGSAYGFRGGLAVGSSHTRSVHQTATSRKLAFPEKNNNRLIVSFALLLVIAYLTTLVSSTPGASLVSWVLIVLAIAGIAFSIYRKIDDRPKRQNAANIWHRLFYCQRDDTIFAPDDPTLRAPANHMRNLLNY